MHSFNEMDTSYIEPQQYNFTVMLQHTMTYEMYRVSSRTRHSITFAPEATVRVGPYLGWRWIFLGYTLDVKHLNLLRTNSKRKEYDLSLYSSMLGIDIYYRKTGNDYKIRRMSLGDSIDTRSVRGADFGGLRSSIKGFNLYYIFNHRRFSYPAAFSQSTVQRRSAGSVLLGIGYTRHTLSIDWAELNRLIERRLGKATVRSDLDSTLLSGTVKYTDVSLSGGYAYNWVFAHNWLLAGSLSMALAYKRSTGDTDHRHFSLREFTFSNFNLDGIGRFGLVWNNARWYAGASAIFHTYNYRRSRFSTNNIFGNVNVYFGMNFGRKGYHKKKKP